MRLGLSNCPICGAEKTGHKESICHAYSGGAVKLDIQYLCSGRNTIIKEGFKMYREDTYCPTETKENNEKV